MRSTCCSVSLIVMMLSISFVIVPANPVCASSPSGPLSIEGDSDLRTQAGHSGWQGDGSASRPIVIERLAIDGGSQTGIMIRDTDLHLVIRNCTITDSVRCIDIAGSSNVMIENNSFTGNQYGCDIYLQGSENILVRGNLMDGNDNGMFVSDSSHNSILYNTITDTRWDGIDMESQSDNNTISHNTISGAIDCDVYLSMSDGNTISLNTLSGAHHGICLDSSSSNLVSENFVGDSDNDEIYILSSMNNTISDNTILGGVDGIHCQYSNGNVISDNVVNGAMGDDILLEDSISSFVSENTVTGADDGIHLTSTEHSTVSYNTVEDANFYGIFLEQTANDTISHNFLADSVCYQGIYLFGSSKCLISDNTIVSSTPDSYGIISSGINLDTSSAWLEGNELTDCLIIPSMDGNGNDRSCINGTTVSQTNTVNGQPVYFFKNEDMNGVSVPTEAGEVLLFNVTRADIQALDMHAGLVFIGYSSDIIVEYCSIENSAVGVYLFESDHCRVVDNEISDAHSCGIIVEGSQNNSITGNSVSTNEPIALGCIFMIGSEGNTVSNNSFSGADVMLEGSGSNLLDHNTISGADEGIYVQESDGNTFSRNFITSSSSYGIYLTVSHDNTLYSNVLVGNDGSSSLFDIDHVQGYDDGENIWNTATAGNYWADWQGPDVSNPHGIVDRPYSIDGGSGAQDLLPMVMGPSPITVSIVTPVGGSWNGNGSVMVAWTASDALYGVAKTEISTDGAVWTDVTGTYSYLFVLDDGTHTFYVRATSNQGQVRTASATVHVDTTSPSLSLVGPRDHSFVNSGTVNVTWTASDAGSGIAKTEISVDAGPWSNVPGTSARLTGLGDGLHTVTVRTTDNVGNAGSATASFTVDTTGPVLSLMSPEAGSWQNGNSLNVHWTASDPGSGTAYCWLSLDNGPWTNTTQESIALHGLYEGQHTLELRAFDAVGNHNSLVRTFHVETSNPALSIALPVEDGLYNSSTVSITWSANGMSNIVRYEVSCDGRAWTDVGSGTSLSLTGLSDGGHSFALRCQDLAGNWNETSVTFRIDVSSPVIVRHSPVGPDVPANATIMVSFSEEMDRSSFRFLLGDVSGTISWTGNDATFTPASALTLNKTYTAVASGMDLAGNPARLSWSFTTAKVEGQVTVVIDHGSNTSTNGSGNDGANANHDDGAIEGGNGGIDAGNNGSIGRGTGDVVEGEIKGVIEDGFGNPIENAIVRLSNGMTTMTDSRGHFVFGNVTAGTYKLNATKAGFEPIVQDVSASPGQTNELGTLSASAVQPGSPTLNGAELMFGVGALAVASILLSALWIFKRRSREA